MMILDYSLFLIPYHMMKSRIIAGLAGKVSYHLAPTCTSNIRVHQPVSDLTTLNERGPQRKQVTSFSFVVGTSFWNALSLESS